MSDVIYYKNGKETFRISPPTVGTKCPETKLELKKMTEIEKVKGEIKVLQAKLALLEEMEKTSIQRAYKDWWGEYPKTGLWTNYDETRWVGFQGGYEAHQSLVDAANKFIKDALMINCYVEGNPPNGCSAWSEWFELFGSKGILNGLRLSSIDKTKPESECPDEPIWYDEVENEIEKLQEKNWYVDAKTLLKSNWEPKPQTPEQVDAGLRDAMRQAKKDGVFDEPTKPMNEVLDRLENKWNSATENSASYITDEVVNRMLKKWEENPPEFLKFELGETLETRIYKWWTTCYSKHWTIDECTADLLDIVELFLPREQSAEGSQNINTEVAVEAHNELLQKIKSKLRNKK